MQNWKNSFSKLCEWYLKNKNVEGILGLRNDIMKDDETR
jgi:hypothetical protein